MGTITAFIFAALFVFGCMRSPGLAICLAGVVIFLFGLVPLALVTDVHAYVLLGIAQSFSAAPAIPVGIGLIALGRLVMLGERREGGSGRS